MLNEDLDTSRLDSDAQPGTIQTFSNGDQDYAVVRHEKGWSLIPDRCTHSSCRFTSYGEVVDGTTLICNCHGAEFDLVSGEVLLGPAVNRLEVTPLQVKEGKLALAATQDALAVTQQSEPVPAETFTLSADLPSCKGYANCVVAADDFLDLDDDGLVIVLRSQVDADQRSHVEAAVRSCPVAALRLERNR